MIYDSLFVNYDALSTVYEHIDPTNMTVNFWPLSYRRHEKYKLEFITLLARIVRQFCWFHFYVLVAKFVQK